MGTYKPKDLNLAPGGSVEHCVDAPEEGLGVEFLSLGWILCSVQDVDNLDLLRLSHLVHHLLSQLCRLVKRSTLLQERPVLLKRGAQAPPLVHLGILLVKV